MTAAISEHSMEIAVRKTDIREHALIQFQQSVGRATVLHDPHPGNKGRPDVAHGISWGWGGACPDQIEVDDPVGRAHDAIPFAGTRSGIALTEAPRRYREWVVIAGVIQHWLKCAESILISPTNVSNG